MIIARLAEHRLSPESKIQLNRLLKKNSLQDIANEPDGYRSDSKWKCGAPLHYVSIEDNETYLKAEHHAQGDILRALYYFEDVLRDKKASPAMRVAALKWIVHLVADIHQPLHVGRACDRGGNSTQVNWFGEKTNLHKVWDSALINHEELSYTEYTEFLEKSASDVPAATSYLDWAKESQQLRTQIYTCLAKDNCCERTARGSCKVQQSAFGSCADDQGDINVRLEYAYVEKNREMLNRQLFKAGVRLAQTLNRIFAEAPLTARETAERQSVLAIDAAENPVKQCVESAVRP